MSSDMGSVPDPKSTYSENYLSRGGNRCSFYSGLVRHIWIFGHLRPNALVMHGAL